ncbi:hypothetical protein BN2537_15401 [Streptomyces venezuelae]|nr:hypothetical protein BN2537_15401 [Streptomyces venezuelae]
MAGWGGRSGVGRIGGMRRHAEAAGDHDTRTHEEVFTY